MGVDTRLATEGPGVALLQCVEEPEGAKRSRHAHIRRRSKSFMNNSG